MSRIVEADVMAFQAVKTLCYSGLDSATLRQRVGERLARHLRVSAYCFGACEPTTGLPIHSISVGLDATAIDIFHRLMLTTPALDFAPWSGRPRRVACLEEIIPDLDRDPYLNEIIRPAGLRYEVQLACIGAGRTWGHLCLRRRAADGAFAGHELRLLTALAPHLTSGLRAAATRAALAAAPGSQTGVILLSANGGIELANEVAERLLARPSAGLSLSYLSAIYLVTERLRQVLDEANAESLPALTVIDEGTGETYRLSTDRLVGHDGRPRGLVLIEPAIPVQADDTLTALQQLGLTRREAATALAILRGLSTEAVAAELMISSHTVHDHLRQVFTKLEVSSRAQLAARLVGWLPTGAGLSGPGERRTEVAS